LICKTRHKHTSAAAESWPYRFKSGDLIGGQKQSAEGRQVANRFDCRDHVAPEIQFGKRYERVQPLNLGDVVASKIQYAQLSQSDQPFYSTDAVGMKVENVKMIQVLKAIKLIQNIRMQFLRQNNTTSRKKPC
jgi:hypothetical protein